MSINFKSLSKNAIINVFEIVFLSIITFLGFKIIVNSVGISGLGIWSVVISVVSVTRLADLGISDSVTHFVASEYSKDNFINTRKIIQTSLTSILVIFALLSPIIYFVLLFVFEKIFDAQNFILAKQVLPYSILAFGFSLSASIFQSTLDGCNKMFNRSIFIISSQLIYFILVFFLVPKYGIIALAWAQVIQSVVIIMLSYLTISNVLEKKYFFPFSWSKNIFLKIYKYGVNIQFSTFIMLLFDPFAKSLLTYYGGPNLSGYFEIANQLVQKARSIMVSANRSVIPFITKMSVNQDFSIKDFYSENLKVLIHFLVPIFSVLFSVGDIFQIYFLGKSDVFFSIIFNCLIFAWAINTLNLPTYYINMGLGSLKSNTIAHIIIGLTNLLLAPILISIYPKLGPLFAYCISLIAGSIFLIISFHRIHKIKFIDLFYSNNKVLLFITLIYLIIVTILQLSNVSDYYYYYLLGLIIVIYSSFILRFTSLRQFVFSVLNK